MCRTDFYRGDGDLTRSKIPIFIATTSSLGQPPGKFLLLMSLIFWIEAGSTGVLREKEIADDLVRYADPAEVQWLGDGRYKFLSLYRETVSHNTQGAVVLIHDLGSNRDSLNIMKPFRDYLPEHGWTTLTMQMPILDSGAQRMEYYDRIPEARKRILAGVEFLGNQNIRNVVIIGYGFGAVFAIKFLENQNAPTVNALVIISLPATESKMPKSQLKGVLEKIEIPIFDIDFNRGNVRRPDELKKRKRLMRNNKNYRQWLSIETDFGFHDSGMILAKRVYSWLMRVAPGVEIR